MDKDYIEYLYRKYLKGVLNEAEKQAFDEVLLDVESSAYLGILIDQDWDQLNPKNIIKVAEPVSERVLDTVLASRSKNIRTSTLWSRVAAAAIAIVIVGAGFFYYRAQHAKDARQEVASCTTDIAPGKQGATLTLANGKKIMLTDAVNGEIAREAGISVTKTADGQVVYTLSSGTGDLPSGANAKNINTLSTAKGETYQLRLPDGSKVYLNAASSLTYSADLLEKGKRIVTLQGEGYFEIAKDKRHPFIVKTNKQEIEVLGTHFNVNAYADETDTKTTLLEGSVKVVSTANSNNLILKPSQQAVLSDHVFKRKEADVAEVIAWKDGYFRFKDENLKSIMLKLSRWYNIEVRYEANVSTKAFSGKLSRSNHINEILKALETTKGVHFNIEGRRVTVMQ